MTDHDLLEYLYSEMIRCDYYTKYPSRRYVKVALEGKSQAEQIEFLLGDSCLWAEIRGKSGYQIDASKRRGYLDNKLNHNS